MKRNWIWVLLLTMLLMVGCGSDGGEVEDHEPQLGEPITIHGGGYRFRPPQGYNIQQTDSASVELTHGDNAETQISLFGIGLDGMPLDTMVDGMIANMQGSQEVEMGEKEAITLNSYTGYEIPLEGIESEVPLVGRMIILGAGDQMVMMMAGSDQAGWDAGVEADFEAMVETVNLFDIEGSE